MHVSIRTGMQWFFSGAAKFQVDVKEGGGGGGGSDLNVQLTLSGRKVNMSTAPKHIRAYAMKLFCKLGGRVSRVKTNQCMQVRQP